MDLAVLSLYLLNGKVALNTPHVHSESQTILHPSTPYIICYRQSGPTVEYFFKEHYKMPEKGSSGLRYWQWKAMALSNQLHILHITILWCTISFLTMMLSLKSTHCKSGWVATTEFLVHQSWHTSYWWEYTMMLWNRHKKTNIKTNITHMLRQ